MTASRADRVIAFIERLKIPSGEFRGQPFRLREWQKAIIRRIYDPADPITGRRKVRRVILSMARKNAKTTLIAALVLVHLIGPESRASAEVYSAANDREQAAVVFKACVGMIEQDETLTRLMVVVPSKKRIVVPHLGTVYVALSADAKTKHGSNPAVWIYDELAQAPKADLYDALDTSQGAQAEPLGFVISTQAISPLSLMSQLVDYATKVASGEIEDETVAPFIFTVPMDADPFDESLWPLANPALGDFLSLADMRSEAEKAKRMPSRLPIFRNLRLNQQVDGLEHVLRAEDWKACALPVDADSLEGAECFGGLDLSARSDLTSFALVFPGKKKRVLVRTWTPEKNLRERADKDRAPYPLWIEQGWLETTPGASVDYGFVARAIGEAQAKYDLRAVAFDRWRIRDLKRALEAEGVAHWQLGEDDPLPGAVCLIPFGQGFRDMSPAVDQIEEDVTAHLVEHGGNPVLTWAASNAVATYDAANNRKLDKSKARNRIDPFVALVMANCIASRGDHLKEGDDGVAHQAFVEL